MIILFTQREIHLFLLLTFQNRYFLHKDKLTYDNIHLIKSKFRFERRIIEVNYVISIFINIYCKTWQQISMTIQFLGLLLKTVIQLVTMFYVYIKICCWYLGIRRWMSENNQACDNSIWKIICSIFEISQGRQKCSCIT